MSSETDTLSAIRAIVDEWNNHGQGSAIKMNNIAAIIGEQPPAASQPSGPTHWADDRGYVVSDAWLKNDTRSTSDYRSAYNIPGIYRRGKFVPLPVATTATPHMKDSK